MCFKYVMVIFHYLCACRCIEERSLGGYLETSVLCSAVSALITASTQCMLETNLVGFSDSTAPLPHTPLIHTPSYIPPISPLYIPPSHTGTDYCGAQPGPAQMEGEDTTGMDTTSGVSIKTCPSFAYIH